MLKPTSLWMVAALLLSFPCLGSADGVPATGAELIKYCNETNFAATRAGKQGPETIGTVICGEYVSGVLQGIKIGQLEMISEMADTAYQRLGDLDRKTQSKITQEDRQQFVEDMRMKNGHWLCWPTSVTGGQMLDIVAKYLQDHPEDLGQSSALLVYSAIHDAFKDQKC